MSHELIKLPATILILKLLLFAAPEIVCLDECVFSSRIPPPSPANKQLECTNLFDFPDGSDSIEVLRARNNTFIKISTGVFLERRLTSLRAVIVRHGKIKTIEDGAFNGLDSLILLDLEGNQLEAMEVHSFLGATQLRALLLSGNQIKTLKTARFARMTNLIYLDLSFNRVQDFSRDFLSSFPKLKGLDLSNNAGLKPGTGLFLSSNSLEILRLANCGLQNLPQDFFYGLENLQVLDLTHNNLKVLSIHPLYNLRVLHADTNFASEQEFFGEISTREMRLNSAVIETEILNNLEDLTSGKKQLDLLKLCRALNINEDKTENGEVRTNWKITVQKCLLFSLLAYLSFICTMLLSQVFKVVAAKPYQKVHSDDDDDTSSNT